MKYKEFLKAKEHQIQNSGFNCDNLNNNLFPFQKFIVERALNAGRYAVFSDCGTGKTIIQLEWARKVVEHTGLPVLILAPLAVSGQTINEGKKFGIEVIRYNDNILPNIYITNYENLDNVKTDRFSGIVLDESSILKNFTGKFKQKIIDYFKNTPYKLACTATPSPNDPMELGNHSEFLNVMSRNEMLAMYFFHDGGNTSKWKLKGHAEDKFWQFVSEWSIMLSNPSDIGFKQNGFDLPDLNFIEKQIKTDQRNNGKLFNDIAVNATNFNKELRLSMNKRCDIITDIVNNSNENFIIWVKHNEESKLLNDAIPGSIEVKGSDKPEYKEEKLLGFANNQFRVLITKSKIAQFGLNYQNCHNQIFAGLDFSFESLYQSIRRSYRFGQKNKVNVYLITTDTMQNVIESIDRKRKQFEQMQNNMTLSINKTNVIMKTENQEIKEENYHIKQGDCVELIKELEDESIDFSIFSPPFASLYTYSNDIEDMGNCKTPDEFYEHFKYLTSELFRVIKSGRLVAVHCMDLPIQKGKEGFIGLRDFSGKLINQFINDGFIYHDRITIWKDPVIEMQRTKALGLLHKQLKKDSAMCRTGLPDYVLVFRKPGENKEPIRNDSIPVDIWQKYASPVWHDINQTNTLQFRTAKDQKDEKHICPLQLDTIERAITLWSNKGDTIYSPFAGIGSEGWKSLKMNRKFKGHELKESYFNVMKKNMKNAVLEKNQLVMSI